jgi:hypothetical protein
MHNPSPQDLSQVDADYLALPRAEINRADLFELKFAYLQWRHRFTQPSPTVGPSLLPAFQASRESPWTWQRILNEPRLADYTRDSDGHVLYRGCSLQPGDLLLVNLANPSEGIFTFFAAEDNYAYHLALYVEIAWQGRLVPCVYESYEHGTRIVPLNSYLAPGHTWSVEVLRLPDLPQDSGQRLSQAVLAELQRPHAFDLSLSPDAESTGRLITCTSAVGNVLKQAGITLDLQPSRINPVLGANLQLLGARSTSFIVPSDFLRLPGLEPVGFIDNDGLDWYVATALTLSRLRAIFGSGQVQPTRDCSYRFYLWGVEEITNKRPIMADLLLGIFQFTAENFPQGDSRLLALALRLEEEIDATVSHLQARLASDHTWRQSPDFSIHGLMQDAYWQDQAQRELAGIQAWFASQ